jgi:phage terminase small subunit
MSRLPEGLNIIRGERRKSCRLALDHDLNAAVVPDWITNPHSWDRNEFIESASGYLHQKNGSVDIADRHLLGILASQIEIYIECVMRLRKDGLVTSFNAGMTSGPNPHIAIADKALNRSVQIMKELELSPKSREGYKSNSQRSSELQRLLDGP